MNTAISHPSAANTNAQSDADKAINLATEIAADHHYKCTCDHCLTFWAACGPDGGDAGEYGPFRLYDVNQRQRELGLPETQ